MAFWVSLVLLALTWRGLRALAETLWADLKASMDAPESEPAPRPRRPLAAPALVDGHTPLNRVLAFQGVARRVRARRRWEAGFGRRGL